MLKIINNQFPIVCIVEISKNYIIGDGKKLLWRIPNDLKRLKKITMGNPLIMGRKTYESIGKPLIGRANIVLTRKKKWQKDGIIIVNNLESAIEKSNVWINENYEKDQRKNKQIFIFGGGEIYNLALDYCQKIEMTIVDIVVKDGIEFPRINDLNWNKQLLECKKSDGSLPSYSYWFYERKKY